MCEGRRAKRFPKASGYGRKWPFLQMILCSAQLSIMGIPRANQLKNADFITVWAYQEKDIIAENSEYQPIEKCWPHHNLGREKGTKLSELIPLRYCVSNIKINLK